MFTDIVGFTEFTAVRGDEEALALLDVQDALVRAALPPGARIVKELGDGLLLWFDAVVPAVLVCLELLARFQDVDGGDSPLWVRMGMHWGSPTPRGEDLVGHDVNVAARIVDVAGPGELLVSADVSIAASGALTGICLEELGPVVMRGIPDPIPLYRAARAASPVGADGPVGA